MEVDSISLSGKEKVRKKKFRKRRARLGLRHSVLVILVILSSVLIFLCETLSSLLNELLYGSVHRGKFRRSKIIPSRVSVSAHGLSFLPPEFLPLDKLTSCILLCLLFDA